MGFVVKRTVTAETGKYFQGDPDLYPWQQEEPKRFHSGPRIELRKLRQLKRRSHLKAYVWRSDRYPGVAIRPDTGSRGECHVTPVSAATITSRGDGIGWPYVAGTDRGIDVFSASKPLKIRHIWRRGSPPPSIEFA